MKRKGWFIIPGVQDGDRTIDEQMTAVWPAVGECAGKTVLDLGCAEGLIGREFARAGALSVLGIVSLEDHLAVARQQCAGLPMVFEQAYLLGMARQHLAEPGMQQYDIVLALGIAHKIEYPDVAIRFAALSSSNLVLMRSGRGAVDNVIRYKYCKRNSCDSHAVMRELGFTLEKTVTGPPERKEDVEYWRRA